MTPDTQLFRDVFNASPIGIVVETLEGQPLFVNPAFCSMLGFSEEELRRKHCVDFSPPEDAKEDWTLFQQLKAGQIDHYQLEKRYVRRDRSLVWGRLSLSLLNGRPSPLVIAIVEDITDKKTAEEVIKETNRALEKQTAILQAGEELLKIFVKNVPAGVAMLDREMRYLQVSDRWCADYGVELSQVLGRSHYEVFPEMPDLWKEVHRRALEGEMVRADEDRWDRPVGTTWVRWEVRPWKTSLGSIGGILIFAEDITHRKQADEAIRESEKQFRTIVETTNEGVWLLDSKLHTSYVNRQMAEMLGYEPEQIVGRSVFDFYFADDVEHKKQVLSRRQQGLSDHSEERLLRKDGKELWVRMAATPVFKDNGEFGGALAMMADITERKRAEKALADMSRKLIEAQEQERSRIGRELHDDINQRLAMLALELERLQDCHPEVRNTLQEVRQQMTDISNDVQSLSHELHSSKLEYLGVVGGIKSWCKEFAERQRMEIDFKSDVHSVLPFEVGVCLFRVLQEALHNAVKHSGVKYIEVQLAEESNELHLIISDSGAGFDVEVAMKGKGLGLTSMCERVRLVNGTIDLDSKPMAGTTIHVRVPLASDQAQKAAG